MGDGCVVQEGAYIEQFGILEALPTSAVVAPPSSSPLTHRCARLEATRPPARRPQRSLFPRLFPLVQTGSVLPIGGRVPKGEVYAKRPGADSGSPERLRAVLRIGGLQRAAALAEAPARQSA